MTSTGQGHGPDVRPTMLRLSGVARSYGSNRVLSDVSLDVRAGEVTALLGENGAGKSTLAKIIAGVQRHDAGTVEVAGQGVSFASPRAAMQAGVAFIPQELVHVPDLTVAENICLGRLPGRAGTTTARAVVRQAAAEAASVGFDLPLTARMGSVPLMQQQLAVILRALASRPRVMVLDEPTAALEARDSAALLQLVHRLAAQGTALVYISHRLEEVFSHCDTVHVLREGRLVLSGDTRALSRREVVHAMIDKDVDDIVIDRPPVPPAAPAFTAVGWTKRSHPVLDDVSVSVLPGEVVGVYGLRGSGADTLLDAVCGAVPDASGELSVCGEPVSVRTPHSAVCAGIRHVPADRKSQGLVLQSSVMTSYSAPALGAVSRWGWVRTAVERKRSRALAVRTVLRAARLSQPVGDLSGGNQQKVLLGSRLAEGARVLVLQEPTRGVDVNARLEIHRLLRSLAAGGTPQLISSSDLEELVIVCNRIVVMRSGRVVHEVRDPHLSSQAEILHHAGGLEE